MVGACQCTIPPGFPVSGRVSVSCWILAWWIHMSVLHFSGGFVESRRNHGLVGELIDLL